MLIGSLSSLYIDLRDDEQLGLSYRDKRELHLKWTNIKYYISTCGTLKVEGQLQIFTIVFNKLALVVIVP